MRLEKIAKTAAETCTEEIKYGNNSNKYCAYSREEELKQKESNCETIFGVKNINKMF